MTVNDGVEWQTRPQLRHTFEPTTVPGLELASIAHQPGLTSYSTYESFGVCGAIFRELE
jgi:hypothetical protein